MTPAQLHERVQATIKQLQEVDAFADDVRRDAAAINDDVELAPDRWRETPAGAGTLDHLAALDDLAALLGDVSGHLDRVSAGMDGLDL